MSMEVGQFNSIWGEVYEGIHKLPKEKKVDAIVEDKFMELYNMANTQEMDEEQTCLIDENETCYFSSFSITHLITMDDCINCITNFCTGYRRVMEEGYDEILGDLLYDIAFRTNTCNNWGDDIWLDRGGSYTINI